MVAEREEVQLTEKREDPQNKTKGNRNEMEIVFDAISCNESFARVAVAAFITHLNPTLEELADINCSVGSGDQCHYSRLREPVRVQQTWGKHSGVQHCSSGKSADALCSGGRYVIHRDHRSGKGDRGS